MCRILLILTLLYSPLSANQIPGCKTLTCQKMNSYTADGVLKAWRCDFYNYLTVNGLFDGDKCQVNELTVNGDAKLHECIIHGPAEISGEFDASYSVFQDDIILSCPSVTFNRCVILENIHIKYDPNAVGKQVVWLKNGSFVKGNITFDSKDGMILISKDSQFKGGAVGGHLQIFAD